MWANVEKVLERDQKLSELENHEDALQAGASQFEKSAAMFKILVEALQDGGNRDQYSSHYPPPHPMEHLLMKNQ